MVSLPPALSTSSLKRASSHTISARWFRSSRGREASPPIGAEPISISPRTATSWWRATAAHIGRRSSASAVELFARSSVMRRIPATLVALVASLWLIAAAYAATTPGMSLFGDLKYGPDFKNFDYVNPGAPKGGTMRLSAIGTFDTLNPYVVKGIPAAGIGGIFDTLTVASEDEPGSEYGLAAETIDVAPDKLSVLYTLRKEARFHDGSPMTPDDVVWTFETLGDKGHPRYRSYYGDVTKVEKAGDRGIRFTFKSAENRELPQIIGQMPVLSKAYWTGRDFSKTTLEPPLGSGAYKVDSFDTGRSVT